MADITLRRTGQTVKHKGSTGEIDELTIGSTHMWAVERRDGFLSLDPGTYTVKMEFSPNAQEWTKKGDKLVPSRRRQLRVLNHGKKTKDGDVAAILIHAANYPDELAGCIAPGTALLAGGVDSSRDAMDQIFDQLGGFQQGGIGTLVITGDSDE
ncbi:MAG TPA: DUF5675 family protein [Gemmatimonadales bacterium]|nr:DUF5675 family protein [Gemmatimonadales bacterium]